MKKMKIEGTDIETKIMPLYKAGKSIKEIADEFCIRDTTKLQNAIDRYLLIQDNYLNIENERIKNFSRRDLLILYRQGYSFNQIGKMYNISGNMVRVKLEEYCNEHHISLYNKSNYTKKEKIEKEFDEELAKKIVEDYRNGLSLFKISKKYNITVGFVRKNLYQLLSIDEIQKIVDNNRIKMYFNEEDILEVKYLYESGNYTISKIAKKFNSTHTAIEKVLLSEYEKQGFPCIPTVVSKNAFLKILSKHKYTREEIIEYSKAARKVIPLQFLDEYYSKEINMDIIRKFVINQYTSQQYDENLKKEMFKSFNIASILKNNGYNLKYQAVAILYLLPKITNTTFDDISKVIDNDQELINSIKILNLEETDNEYDEKIKNDDIALKVRIAEIIEEIKRKTLEDESIKTYDYTKYYDFSKNTSLRKDFLEAIDANIIETNIKGYEH